MHERHEVATRFAAFYHVPIKLRPFMFQSFYTDMACFDVYQHVRQPGYVFYRHSRRLAYEICSSYTHVMIIVYLVLAI